MQSEPMSLYAKKQACPYCNKEFTSMRVKVSKVRVKKIDPDFCTWYGGENPYFYAILVCPYCAYAYGESTSRLKRGEGETLASFLEKNPVEDDFSGARNYQLAVKAYLRAVEIAKVRKEKNLVIANYYLQISWIYRYVEDLEKELDYARKSLQYFEEFYEKDTGEVENMAKALFIMGELNRKLGDDSKAILWYTKIINDKKIRDAGIIRKAREQWQEIRGYDG